MFVTAEAEITNEKAEKDITPFYFDIEVQTYLEKEIELRMRYYFDIMDLHTLHSETKYTELSDQFVVFISTVNLFNIKYAFDYVENTWHYTQEPYKERRHLLFLTNHLRERHPKFEKIVELVDNLAQTNPDLITDEKIRNAFIAKQEEWKEDDEMREDSFTEIVRSVVNEVDPGGVNSRKELAKVQKQLEEANKRANKAEKRANKANKRANKANKRANKAEKKIDNLEEKVKVLEAQLNRGGTPALS